MLASFFRALARRYPLTWAGSLLILLSGFLLTRALASGNGAGVILALCGLGTPLFLLAINLLCSAGYGRLAAGLSWNLPAYLMSQRVSQAHSLSIQTWSLPRLFSLHLDLGQRYSANASPSFFCRTRLRAFGAGSHPIAITPPLCGTATLDANLSVRDFFGFTRIALPALADGNMRELPVLPPAVEAGLQPPLSVAMATSSRFLRSGEEEKVLTRDYILGDPGRDIHWKAYARISKLITRVAPESREEERRYCVVLRLCGPAQLAGTLLLAAEYARGLCASLVAGLLAQEGQISIELFVQNRKFQLDSGDDEAAWRQAIAEASLQEALAMPPPPRDLSVMTVLLSSDPLVAAVCAAADRDTNACFLVRGPLPGEEAAGLARLPGRGLLPALALLRGAQLPAESWARAGIQELPFAARFFV